MKVRFDVKVVLHSIPCVVEVPLEDGRKVLLPGKMRGEQFIPDWSKVAPGDVEQAKAHLDQGVVVSFG